MKKHAILLLAVLMLLALAAPAAAKPNCDAAPWHPACGGANDEPAPAGHECMGDVAPGEYAAAVSADFGFTLGRVSQDEYYGGACIDVSKIDPSGPWTISFNVTGGTLRELLVLVRDSVGPGDLCNYGKRFRNVSSDSFTLEPNARDYVNSCGTEFAEMIGDTYYGEFDEWTLSPLAFLVMTRGTADLVVDFQVDYPNA